MKGDRKPARLAEDASSFASILRVCPGEGARIAERELWMNLRSREWHVVVSVDGDEVHVTRGNPGSFPAPVRADDLLIYLGPAYTTAEGE